MNHNDETRIQPMFDTDGIATGATSVRPEQRRRSWRFAALTGVVAALTIGGLTLAGCGGGGDDGAATEVAGAVLVADQATGSTGAGSGSTGTGSTGTDRPAGAPAEPPAPGAQQGDSQQGGGQGGGTSPQPTAPPVTEPPAPQPTVPPAPEPTVPPAPEPTVPPVPGGPQLLASPLSLNYGMSTGTRNVTVKNTGGSTLQWSSTPNKAWLTVTPSVGTVAPGEEAQIQVKALPTGAPGSAWGGSVLFNSNGGSFAMPVSGTFKFAVVDGGFVALPVKPVIQSVAVPPMVCKNAAIPVVAKVIGDVTSVKLERTMPNATVAMTYNDAMDTATKVVVAPGFPTIVQVTVVASGPGGTVESAAHNVSISPFC